MGQSEKYKNQKYPKAKEMYLSGEYSLTQISSLLHMDRGALSKNLKEDGILVVNKQNQIKLNQYFFDNIDSEEKAYWLGFMYADGYVSTKENLIEVSLKSSDIGHLEKFINSLNFIDKKIFQDEIRCRLNFRNKHMHDMLIQQGCLQQKSLILKFPNEQQVPEHLLYHFLRGYVDGDGSIMLGKNHKDEYVKPRLSILGTKDFLETLLDKTGWNHCKIQQSSNAYCIEWGGQYVLSYLNQLYENATIYLDRKYNKYKEIKMTVCRSKK